MMTTEDGLKTLGINESDIRRIALAKQSLTFRPFSVYRLQMNKDFNLREALSILPYLKELGVGAVYISPIFEVVPGSPHGYNITDSNRINPEIGSEDDFTAFSDALRQSGMGLIADVVPNHMGISAENNRWWMDVLENGPSSHYANFFDIDWEPVKKELKDKILLPVLGDHYGVVLENQEIQMNFESGSFFICCAERRFPIAPDTYPQILEYGIDEVKSKFMETDRDFLEYLSILASLKNLPPRSETNPEKMEERSREKEIAKNRLRTITEHSRAIREVIENRVKVFNGTKGDAQSFDLLDSLLKLQSYRLSCWRVASEEINYRRFFDISELAAIRVEEDEVFEAYQCLLFKWLRQGKVQGLRIDHPDGLYDPVIYFRKLQKKFFIELIGEELAAQFGVMTPQVQEQIEKVVNEEVFQRAAPLYVVVEKILDRKEDLPENWAVYGTVGYDFLNVLNGLFVARKNENLMTDIYDHFTGTKWDFEQLLYEKKKFFAAFYMASEVNTLAHHLDSISEKIRRYRDFTLSNLATALREVIACFPVYRTYIQENCEVSERDRKYIHSAIEKAKRKHPALSPGIFQFLKQVLLGQFEYAFTEEERKLFRGFVLKFQQLTAPMMAKGLEDTAFYIYNRLISRNDVGGDPFHFGYTPGEFHKQNAATRQKWPLSFITSSTHDTKRSEDVRMRIDVLSEIPEEWNQCLQNWSRINEKHKTTIGLQQVPEKNTEYFIYQSLLGVWPNEPLSSEDFDLLRERLWNYFLKAVREAKTFTNWMNPNEEYEQAVQKFVSSILSQNGGNAFLKSFLPFQKKVSNLGMLNSISAIALKACSPGVADYYQGTGVWDYSLVDPDNRRPVDFNLRKNLLMEVRNLHDSNASKKKVAQGLLNSKEDGRIKMFLVWKALNLRKQHQDLLLEGDYVPLVIEGDRHENAVAFMRRKAAKFIIVVCGRFFSELIHRPQELPVGEKVWGNTSLILPAELKGDLLLVELFTGLELTVKGADKPQRISLQAIFQSLSVAILTNFEIGVSERGS